MIDIQRLRLHLPAGFEQRATTISRLVGEALARQSITGNRSLDSLNVRGVQISTTQSDAHVAGKIAAAIASNLHHQAPSTQMERGQAW